MTSVNLIFFLLLGLSSNVWTKIIDKDINNQADKNETQGRDTTYAYTGYTGYDTTPGTVCTSIFKPVGDRCLFADNTIVGTWQANRDVCTDLHGDLPNLSDANFLADINDYLKSHELDNVNYWVGSNDQDHEGVWQWANDLSQVKLGTPLWGDNTNREQDPRGSYDQNCGALMAGDYYFMHDERCTDTYGLLCEQFHGIDKRISNEEPTGTTLYRTDLTTPSTTSGPAVCPDPYEMIHDQCLFINTLAKNTWDSHKIFCESMGGHMVKLSDANVLGSIYDHLRQKGIHGDFWTGANDYHQEEQWHWHDGSNVRLGTPFWGDNGAGPQNPDGGVMENCGMISEIDHYFFNDANCESLLYVICQIDLN